MHLVVIKHQIAGNHDIGHELFFLPEKVLQFPGEQNIVIKAGIDGQPSGRDAAKENGENINARGNDGHINADADQRIRLCLCSLPEDQSNCHGNCVDQDSENIRAAGFQSLFYGFGILGILQDAIQKVGELRGENNSQDDANNIEKGFSIPGFTLGNQDEGNHDQGGTVEGGSQKDDAEKGDILLLQHEGGGRENQKGGKTLANAVAHPGDHVRGSKEEENRKDIIVGIFAVDGYETKALNQSDDEGIGGRILGDQGTNQNLQDFKALIFGYSL